MGEVDLPDPLTVMPVYPSRAYGKVCAYQFEGDYFELHELGFEVVEAPPHMYVRHTSDQEGVAYVLGLGDWIVVPMAEEWFVVSDEEFRDEVVYGKG